jgi:uncharacterized protein with PIN domain
MYDRLAAGYRFRLRLLLELAGEAEPAEQAARIVAEALDHREAGDAPAPQRLFAESHARRERARAAALAAGATSLRAAFGRRTEASGGALGEPAILFCDASLVALARWLCAAGQEARTHAGVWALDLVTEALRARGVLLTTDHRTLEFGCVRDGRVATLWLPSNVGCQEQLRTVVADLDLERAQPRCMRCACVLATVGKQCVRERIPPRTALWLDAYFECRSCGQLYWQGTHWQRIDRQLARAFAAVPNSLGASG